MRFIVALVTFVILNGLIMPRVDAQIAHIESKGGGGGRDKPHTRPPVIFPFNTANQGTTFFGGTVWDGTDGRWEALTGTYWTFDSGVASTFSGSVPGLNPFKSGGLHTRMEGWVGVDRTYSSITYFRRLGSGDGRWGSDICVGAAGGLGGTYSFWCGVFPAEADTLCWSTGQGYGNNWTACIGQTFAWAAGSVTLGFDYVNETESDFDFTEVIVDTSGGSGDDVVVATYSGSVSGTESITLLPGVSLPSSAGDVVIKFCFRSDGARSDEDGLFPTDCGGFAVDNISLSGGLTHGTTFEAGTGGWALLSAVAGKGGDWSDIVDLTDLPAPLTPCTCAMEDTVLVFDDLSMGTGHGVYQSNAAVSPWIDLDAAGEDGNPGKLIQFDGYFDLPFLNYVFVTLEVQWYPKVCPTTGLTVTSGFVSDYLFRYFGDTPVCSGPARPYQVDVGGLVGVGATEMRIAVGVVNYCRFFADCTGVTNSTPWFDNICVGVYGDSLLPYICTRTIDVPQDIFPENGTLNITAPGRLDSNTTKNFGGPEMGSSLGDTLTVCGGTGDAEVFVEFTVAPGPGTDAVALAAWLASVTFVATRDGEDWYQAEMDTAEVGGVPILCPLVFMTTRIEGSTGFSGTDTSTDPDDLDPNGNQTRLLNDIFPDDLFTAGTRVNMFFKTRFVGGSSWFTEPDTSGGSFYEWENLPSSMDADSTFNCVLYVDHFNRGAQAPIETALTTVLGTGGANYEGTNWDRYDVQAPDSKQASFGRPLNTEYGATVVQALGYPCIIWNSGTNPTGNLSKEDADVLIPWATLEDFDYRNLYLSGDGLVESVNAESASEPSALKLIEDIAGVTFTCGTFRDAGCPPAKPLDLTACVNLDPVGGAKVANFPVRAVDHEAPRNGCPTQRSFDVLDENPSPDYGVATGDEEYSTAASGAVAYASVAIDASDNGSLNYKMVVDGVSVHRRSDDGGACGTGFVSITERLNEVLAYFGHPDEAVCTDKSAGTGTKPIHTPVFTTTLLNASPNPLRSGGTGQLRFTMERSGNASLQIFDLRGRLVKALYRGLAPEGETSVTWNGTDETGRRVASGVYFYRLDALGKSFSQKLVVIRLGG